MLALTRRVGEEVVIGDPRNPLGMIRVVEIHGDKVRLSFDFPREVKINRKELAEQKARQGAIEEEQRKSEGAPPKPPNDGVEQQG
jgi:carbon storage regulator